MDQLIWFGIGGACIGVLSKRLRLSLAEMIASITLWAITIDILTHATR